jgi:hypothetical protein
MRQPADVGRVLVLYAYQAYKMQSERWAKRYLNPRRSIS